MALLVLSSLALMLQLMASLLHFVSLGTPGWVQFGVYVPTTRTTVQPDDVEGNRTVAGNDVIQHQSSRTAYVQLRLGLWDWCQQFEKVSADCQEPEFLPALRFLAMVTMVTLPLCLALMLTKCFLDPQSRRRHAITVGSLVVSIVSAIILLLLVVIYAVGTEEEVKKLLQAASVRSEGVHYLGWAFGTEVVTMILTGLAALLICIDLRHSSKPLPPAEFSLVV